MSSRAPPNPSLLTGAHFPPQNQSGEVVSGEGASGHVPVTKGREEGRLETWALHLGRRILGPGGRAAGRLCGKETSF